MDVQKFADTPIEPPVAQWMHPDFADHASILSAGRSSTSFVEDHQISPPFAHNSGDFNCNDNEICEYCAPTQFGQVADKSSCVSYIDPKAYQTTEWLSSLSDASSQSSAPCRASSITTPSFIAGSPTDDFQNYFKDDTTAALEVNALSSSAVDTIGGTILRFPSDARPLTRDTNCLPEADPQSPPHQHNPLLEIRTERAVNVKEGNDTLLEPSHAPIRGQILTATALGVTSQDTVASGTYKEPRRSPRNSKSAKTDAQTNFNRTKTLDRGHRSASTSIQWPRTPQRLRSTQPPSHSMNQTTFSYTNSNPPKGSNRASHNLVEKQYRTRLNRQFGALLSAIPNDVIAADVNGSPEEGG
ncbi:hypothetical protein G7Y89_g9117 [Cudoniella acicularis]|uniref:BHLH domain-containing protein n=1 Tax=Cudoniella acicularis TaxID=354080 RepID=A0A8H4RJ02_9HELO|nr:hypothetical protein G7Y89_g9117 [Cudoniella acicularis]